MLYMSTYISSEDNQIPRNLSLEKFGSKTYHTLNSFRSERFCSNVSCGKYNEDCYCNAFPHRQDECILLIFCPVILPTKQSSKEFTTIKFKIDRLRLGEGLQTKAKHPSECENKNDACRELSSFGKDICGRNSLGICLTETRFLVKNPNETTQCVLYVNCENSFGNTPNIQSMRKMYGIVPKLDLNTVKEKFRKNITFKAQLNAVDCHYEEICSQSISNCECRIERRCLKSICICIFKHKCSDNVPPDVIKVEEPTLNKYVPQEKDIHSLRKGDYLHYQVRNETQCKEIADDQCKSFEELCTNMPNPLAANNNKGACIMESKCDDNECVCVLALKCHEELEEMNKFTKRIPFIPNEIELRKLFSKNTIALAQLGDDLICDKSICAKMNASDCANPICEAQLKCYNNTDCLCELMKGCSRFNKPSILHNTPLIKKEVYIRIKDNGNCSNVKCLDHGCINEDCIVEKIDCFEENLCQCRISCEVPFLIPMEISTILRNNGGGARILLNTSIIPCKKDSVCTCQEGCHVQSLSCTDNICLCSIRDGNCLEEISQEFYTTELTWKYTLHGIVSPELKEKLRCSDDIVCNNITKIMCPYGSQCYATPMCENENCYCTVSINCFPPPFNSNKDNEIQSNSFVTKTKNRTEMNYQIIMTQENIKRNGFSFCVESCVEALTHCRSKNKICHSHMNCFHDYCTCGIQIPYCFSYE